MSHLTTDSSIFPRRGRGRTRLLRVAGVPLVTALAVLALASCGDDEAAAEPAPAATASDVGRTARPTAWSRPSRRPRWRPIPA